MFGKNFRTTISGAVAMVVQLASLFGVALDPAKISLFVFIGTGIAVIATGLGLIFAKDATEHVITDVKKEAETILDKIDPEEAKTLDNYVDSVSQAAEQITSKINNLKDSLAKLKDLKSAEAEAVKEVQEFLNPTKPNDPTNPA